MAKKTSPPAADGQFPVLNITSHRGLAVARQEIANRLQANPDIARLLLVNPLCAFQDVGVQVSPEIASHILHTMQYSAEAAAQRTELTAKLTTVAGGPPQASDPAWVSKFLFETLKLKPLQTTGATPIYKPTTDPAIAANQLASIPTLNTAPVLPQPDHGTAFVFDSITPGVRNLDLDTPAPKLAYADAVPATVDLTALYFYKDADPSAHDLLQLGVIETQSFPINSPDNYRQIKSGALPNPWGSWVSNITFTPAK